MCRRLEHLQVLSQWTQTTQSLQMSHLQTWTCQDLQLPGEHHHVISWLKDCHHGLFLPLVLMTNFVHVWHR